MRLIHFLDRGASIAPQAVALDGEGGRFTFEALIDLTHRFALGLRARGAGERTPIAILTPNDTRGLVCVYGIQRLGGVYARLNFRSALEESLHILRTSEAEWLFFHSAAIAHVEAIRAAVPSLRHFICIDRDDLGFEGLMDFLSKHSGRAPSLEEDRDHIVMLASTGGTTALPKLVMLTDLNFETAVAAQLSLMPCEGRPVYLVASAMTHAASTIGYGLMSRGARLVLLGKSDPLEIMETIQRERVTHLYLPPTVIYMMLAHEKVRSFDYSSLQAFIYGASPMSAAKLKSAIEIFGPVMMQMYGQAECPMYVTILTPEDHDVLGDVEKEKRLLSAGRPTPFCRVAIMDDAGNLLPPGECGEIVTRGNLVMKGYFKNEAATREASAHGWHHTGDIGHFDADGFLYIVDRKKDLIISGGFNVYPGEIEQVLLSHAAVQECAVIGVPHEKWGEEVRAIVMLRPGQTVAGADLIAFCKTALGSIKAPKTVEFWDALPKSAAGKILKREIRDKYWQGRDRVI